MPRLLLVLLLSGCGPSLHTLYEAESRFEHCYALDESHAVLDARAHCWKSWEARYGNAATRDRVVHARLRLRELNVELHNGAGTGVSTQGLAPAPSR